MLIKVESDFVDSFLRKEKLSVEVMFSLLSAIHYGTHAVFFNLNDYARLFPCTDFGLIERSALLRAKSMNSRIGALKEATHLLCHVTYAQGTHRTDTEIFINPSNVTGFDYQAKSIILTEHLSDSDYFLKFILPNVGKIDPKMRIIIVANQIMGGGNPIGDVMAQEVRLKEHFVLAIVDGDRKYPNHNGEGETSKTVSNALRNNPFNAGQYTMHRVMEVENLIPFALIVDNPNQRTHDIFLHNPLKNYSFFDMKEGLKCSLDPRYNAYWLDNLKTATYKQSYIDATAKFVKDKAKQEKKAKDKAEKTKIEKKVVVKGFGSGLLDETLRQIEERNDPIIDMKELSEEQLEEWETIAFHIIRWCCCYDKARS